MNLKRLSGWLFLGTLLLTVCNPISRSAYASDKPKDEKKSESNSDRGRWTGMYVGVHFGYGMGNGDTAVAPLPSATQFINLAPSTLHPDPRGVIGGAQFGGNWQKGRIVLGGEIDYSGSGMSGKRIISPIIQNNGTPFPGAPYPIGNYIRVHQDTDHFMTLRPRLGVAATSRLLVYGTGGLAIGHVTYSANTDFLPAGTIQYPVSSPETKKGWIIGGGAEYAVSRRWSVRGEYLHYDLGDRSITASPVPPNPPFGVAYTWKTTANIIRGGVNFRF